MKIYIEEIVTLVVKEVEKELKKRGIEIDYSCSGKNSDCTKSISKTIELTFEGFKTPLVTEEKVLSLNENIREVVVPKKTIITPSAFDLIKKRKIKITKQNN